MDKNEILKEIEEIYDIVDFLRRGLWKLRGRIKSDQITSAVLAKTDDLAKLLRPPTQAELAEVTHAKGNET